MDYSRQSYLLLCDFLFLNRAQASSSQNTGINVGIGWIFWLGMFSIVAPSFLSDTTRSALFDRKYFAGTVVFAVINMATPILSAIYTATLFASGGKL